MKKVIEWLTSPAVAAPLLRVAIAVLAAALAGLPPDVAGAAALVGELHKR